MLMFALILLLSIVLMSTVIKHEMDTFAFISKSSVFLIYITIGNCLRADH